MALIFLNATTPGFLDLRPRYLGALLRLGLLRYALGGNPNPIPRWNPIAACAGSNIFFRKVLIPTSMISLNYVSPGKDHHLSPQTADGYTPDPDLSLLLPRIL